MISTAPAHEPIDRFQAWWDELRARMHEVPHIHDDASAMVVSSVDARGRPSSRVVLLRSVDARGFVFYTNLQSRKGRELLEQRVAALNFHWPLLGRQVRVEGEVERVSDEDADRYFAGRPRDSQLGAWASAQSSVLASRDALLARVDEMRLRFEGQAVPRPPHWSGLRVLPLAIELWQEGAFRLHTRERYERQPSGDGWMRLLLAP